jgi:hypothetical protein
MSRLWAWIAVGVRAGVVAIPTLLAMISCSSDVSRPNPIEIEISREHRGEVDQIVVCHVDANVLARIGVDEDQVRTYVHGLLDEVGHFLAEAALEAITGTRLPDKKSSPTPAWVPSVFPDGMDLEILEQGPHGLKCIMREKVP